MTFLRSLSAAMGRLADRMQGQDVERPGAAAAHRRLWLAGRAKLDDWSAKPAAELHVEDAAWVT